MSHSTNTAARARRKAGRENDVPAVRRGTRFHHWFLSRFPVRTKLLLAACLLVIPLLGFSALYIAAQVAQLRSAAMLQRGIELYRPVDLLIGLLDQAMTNAATTQQSAAEAREDGGTLLEKGAAELRTIHSEDQRQGNAHTHDRVSQLQTAFDSMRSAASQDPQKNLAAHAAALEAALALEFQIGSDGGMIRGSDTMSDLLEVTLLGLPRVTRNIAELRARLPLELVPADSGDAQRMRISELTSIAIEWSTHSQERLESAARVAPDGSLLNEQLKAMARQWKATVLPWLTRLSLELPLSRSNPAALRELLAQSEGVDQALRVMHDQLSEAAQTAVLGRARRERVDVWVAVTITSVTVLLGTLLMYAVSSRTAGAVRRLLFISSKIAEGQYNHVIDERGSDEISRLFAGFAEMQRRLTLQIGTERSQLVINSRIRAALDNVAGNVIVAATSGAIVHVNKAASAMLQNTEADIRTRVPEFCAADLHGAQLEPLCEGLAGEPLDLLTLSQTLVREFIAGSRTFRIVVNPILAENGERFGTVVEWTDRTAEAAVERELQAMLTAVLAGSLDQRIDMRGKKGFFETMGRGVNQLAQNMADVVMKVQSAAEEVWRGARELSQGNSNLAQRTQTQAASLERTTTLMATVTETAQNNAESAGQANKLATAARAQAEQGGQVVGAAVEAMAVINDSAKRIADIITVIDEIAFQTNLLALNAAVEAARAGEQGRGFAVVAGEVRSLAGRSAAAAREIKALIEDSMAKVSSGSELVEQSGLVLKGIVTSAKQVADIVADIAVASQNQTSEIEQANAAVRQIEEATQQNAGRVEEAAAAADAMASQARILNELMHHYRVGSAVGVAADAGASSPRRSASR
ncbi:MAG TPA: methyl-accepting chemotaxis protein [Steroidobacteraceae bacterium]